MALLVAQHVPPPGESADALSRNMQSEVCLGEPAGCLGDDEKGSATFRRQFKLINAIEPRLKHQECREPGKIVRIGVNDMQGNARRTLDGDWQFYRPVRARPEQVEAGVLLEEAIWKQADIHASVRHFIPQRIVQGFRVRRNEFSLPAAAVPRFRPDETARSAVPSE